MFSHNSGVVLNAFDSRNAMSGVTELCSFTILESVFLDIPRVCARSDTVKDNGSIYCLFKMPPGCVGGLCLVLMSAPR